MTTTTCWKENKNDAPLPWIDLRQRLDAATFAWLMERDKNNPEQHPQQQQRPGAAGGMRPTNSSDENGHVTPSRAADETIQNYNNGAHLFAYNDDDDDDDQYYPRVHQWFSSLTEPGGVLTPPDRCTATTATASNNNNNNKTSTVQVQYILCDAVGGHGDNLWPASRHIANLLADPVQCRRLLVCMLPPGDNDNEPPDVDRILHDPQEAMGHHPLQGRRFVELGAGAGLPSWTALHCGARVVCTDQPIADRLRTLAESAERNVRDIIRCSATTTQSPVAVVCPYSWGTPVNDVLRALPLSRSTTTTAATSTNCGEDDPDPKEDHDLRFDVVVAADCIYMPDFHRILLQSIHQLLKRQTMGIALLPFALHGNVPDAQVWSIVETARDPEFGFRVDMLESQPLTATLTTPTGMATLDAPRALIHTLRLTLP